MVDNHTDDREDDTTSSPQAERDVEADRVPAPEPAPGPASEIAPEPAPEPAPDTAPEVDAERERLAAERALRREARLAALAPTPDPDPMPVAEAGPQYAVPGAVSTGATASRAVSVPVPTAAPVTKRTTDRFAGSFGLFVLRLAAAAIIGIHGLSHLLNLPATTQMIQQTMLPAPGVLAIVLGAAEVAIAIALVFGLLTRVAGLGLILVAGGALGFVLWGAWSPFTPGQAGFTGALEVLLVAVGVLFMLVGGGGWAIDRAFRARRDEPSET